MDTQELHDRGLALRRELFGAGVDERVRALGDFGGPLQHIINAYAYGDVWSRPGLPMAGPADQPLPVSGPSATGC